jgi:type II secretory pathway pseudopilin PulG
MVATVIIASLLAAGILVGLLFALVFPAVSAARQSAQKSKSVDNMKLIAAAMRSYEADHGCFPPAYVADENGKPMHSWRVLLLPYLGYDHVHDQYDFNQPWDSPQNMNLRYMMPREYACPADVDARSNYETSYMVITGDKTMFPGKECTTRDDITDGLAYTILLAQTRSCGVCWLEPRDLDGDRMRFEINGREGVEISSVHLGGAHVMTADGESHFLADDTPPDYVQAMTTIAGNEVVPWYAVE